VTLHPGPIALQAAAEGSIVAYHAETWTRARRDRDGSRIPARRISVLRSATVRRIRDDGVLDVVGGNGMAFVDPAAVVSVKQPKVES
jgi:hypothetical protein